MASKLQRLNIAIAPKTSGTPSVLTTPHTSDPALELARWLEVEDAVDEPGDWRVVVRIDDGTEVVGEEIAVEIGEGSVSPSGCGEPPPGTRMTAPGIVRERPFDRSLRPIRRA